MNKKTFLLAAIYSIIQLTSFGQCGTPPLDSSTFFNLPWVGNNQLLLNQHDSIKLIKNSLNKSKKNLPIGVTGGFSQNTIFWIPVKAYIISDSQTQNVAIDKAKLNAFVQHANRILRGIEVEIAHPSGNYRKYNGTPSLIQLYLKGAPSTISAPSYVYNIPDNTDPFYSAAFTSVGQSHFNYGAINIYFTNSIKNSNGDNISFATLPFNNDKFKAYRIWMNSSGFPHLSTLAHEVGHALGLLHTHQAFNNMAQTNGAITGKHCYQEKVDRSATINCNAIQDHPNKGETSCEYNGDGLCETEADPGLNFPLNINNYGVYTGSPATDADGDPWTPPIRNLMSYSNQSWKNELVSTQLQIMYNTILNSPVSGYDLHYDNQYVDIYEPDDAPNIPDHLTLNTEVGHYSKLQYGIKQLHGLHKSIHGNRGALNTFSFDDEDWAYFEIGTESIISIRTESTNSGSDVDTKLFLYSELDLQNPISSNDNISVTNKYSEMSSITLAPGRYYVRVQGMGFSSGTYYLTIENCGILCCHDNYLNSVNEVGDNDLFNFTTSHSNTDFFIPNSINVLGRLTFGRPEVQFGSSTIDDENIKSFTASVCNNSTITINDRADLTIGYGSNDADVNVDLTFTSGTTLILKSGSTLNIRNNSHLTIEEGANFIIEEGATINLNGYGALLIFRGKITVGDNATFTFGGNGHFVFDQNIPWVLGTGGNYHLKLNDFWDIGDNTRFSLIGPNYSDKNHLLLEAYKSVYLKMEDGKTFDWVDIKHGKVILHEGVIFFSFSPSNIFYTKFDAPNNLISHGGFRLWNTPNQGAILNTDFYNGNPSALFHWGGSSSPLLISNCNFWSGKTALEFMGGSFNIYNCEFWFNHTSIKATDISGSSSISECELYDGYDEGFYITGTSGSSLTVNSCIFDWVPTALKVDGINTRVTCSEFMNVGQAGIDSRNSHLDLSSDASNFFYGNSNNDVFQWGDFTNTLLFLDNGRNYFTPRGPSSGKYITGYYTGTINSYYSNNLVPADQNKILPYQGQFGQDIWPVQMWHFPTSGSVTTFELDIPNPVPNLTIDCSPSGGVGTGIGSGPGNTFASIVQGMTTSGGSINTNFYPNTLLKTAAIDAIQGVSYFDFQGDDLDANDKLVDISNAVIDNSDYNTDGILRAVYNQMLQAIANCYEYGRLDYAENDDPNGINPHLNDVINTIQIKIDQLDVSDSANHYQHFQYQMDKAHVFMIGGYLDEAISELNSSPQWTYSSEQRSSVDYWTCVCETDRSYYNGALSQEEYALQLEECKLITNFYKTSPAMPYSEGYITKNTVYPEVKIVSFPQPIENLVKLQSTENYYGLVNYTINDITGKSVSSGKITWLGNYAELDLSKLHSGSYIMSLNCQSFKTSLKIIRQ